MLYTFISIQFLLMRCLKLLDLHTHTTASDGLYTPTELVLMAKEVGLTTIAITDHDTTDGVEEAVKCGEKCGVRVISGVEISVSDNKEMHIIGLNVDIKNEALKKVCDEIKGDRSARRQRIVDFLAEKGVDILLTDVAKLAGDKLIWRPHFAMAMVNAGYVKSVDEAFRLYLDTPEFQKIERQKPTAEEAIKLINDAAGVCVLAHPGRLSFSPAELDNWLEKLKGFGLKGLECYYSTHTKEQTRLFLELAKKHELLVTVGTDFHGDKIKEKIKLGTGIDNNLKEVKLALPF